MNIKGIERRVLCASKMLQQLLQSNFFAPEKTKEDFNLSQRSPCKTTLSNHAGFLPFGYLDDKDWSYFEEK